MKICLMFFLLLCVSVVSATTASDQDVLKSIMVCERAYIEMASSTYDSDREQLKVLKTEILREIERKYSKRDSELMQKNATESAAKEEISEPHLKYCSRRMYDLKRQKIGPLKSYLLPN